MSIEQFLQIGRTKNAEDNSSDDAIEDLLEQTKKALGGIGTDAPSSTTKGQVYYKYDPAGATATRVYVKVAGEWK
jgi:hypothetical protein